MTQPTNTFDSYDAVGNREDLSDIIYNIAPIETPFISSIGKSQAYNTLHEWQTDTLAAASTSNAAIEGDDASGTSLSATTRVNNRSQISQKTIVVSGTQDSIRSAGRAQELAYQKAKAMQELKRDMEYAIVRNQASSAVGAATARSSGTSSSIAINFSCGDCSKAWSLIVLLHNYGQ